MLGGDESKLKIVIDAENRSKAAMNEAMGQLDKAKSKVEAMKPAFQKMAIIGTAGFVAISAAVGKSIQQFSDFEKSMSNVSTLVDTGTESMKEMGNKVLDMSKRIPVSIGELTTALYQVRSAGISASDAMSVLESSGKLAIAGLGTTTEATDLLTSAFNVFAKQGYDSNQIADILFKTVKAGKTTVSELAQSFGMVAPIAGELNIDLRELQAGTAALTTTGMKASVAQSQLRASLVALLKPTTDMEDILAEIGVKSGRELIETSGGLVEAFKKVRDITGENDEQLAKVFGSVEALNAVFALTGGTVGDSFIATFDSMKDSTDLLTEAFDKQTETVSAQMQILKNRMNAVSITLGEIFAPILTKLIDKLSPLLEKFVQWASENEKLVMIITIIAGALFGLVAVVGMIGLVLPAIITGFGLVAGVFTLAALKIILIIVAIGLLVAAGIWLYKNWDKVKDYFVQTWEGIKIIFKETIDSVIGFLKLWWGEIVRIFTEIGYFLLGVVLVWAAFLRPIWQPLVDATEIAFSWLSGKVNYISDFVYSVFSQLKESLNAIWLGISGGIKSIWDEIKEYFSEVWEGIKEVIGGAIDWLMNKIQPFLNVMSTVRESISWIAQQTSRAVGGAIDSLRNIGQGGVLPPFQHGGIVPGPIGTPVPILAHAGETIIPAGKGVGMNITITGNTFMSDQEAAERIGNMIIRTLISQNRFAY